MVEDLFGLRAASPGDDGPQLAVISGGGRPRFVVPTDTNAAAAAACLAYNRLRDRRTRLQRAAIGAALRLGGSSLLRPDRRRIDTSDDSLFIHLCELLGRDDLCIAVGLGTFDTVWKPTLQIMSRAGVPIAYVKVGWTPFTTSLVTNEADTLEAIAVPSGTPMPLVAPTLSHRSTWRDRTLVVVSPLPRDVRRFNDDDDVPSPAPVVEMGAQRTTQALGATSWWERLAASIDAGADHSGDRHLAEALGRVADRYASTDVELGRWHGDWTPWNLATSPSRGLVACDWEHSAPDAPVGLDELHSAFQVRRLLRGDDAARAFASSAASAPALIAALHPLVVAERIVAALRAGCDLDDAGAESIRCAPRAVEAALS